jgi:hypothetical protein
MNQSAHHPHFIRENPLNPWHPCSISHFQRCFFLYLFMKPLTLLLAFGWLIFSGCPYLGKKSDKAIDTQLLGTWTSNGWDQNQIAEIKKHSDSEYFIKLTTINHDDTEHQVKFFVGQMGKFKGTTVLNLRKATSTGEASGESYYYFRYELSGGELSTTNLVEPGDYQEKPVLDTQEDFLEYVKSHWNEEGFWGEWTSWSRS